MKIIVNIHLGLSPYYKGSATNFWPFVYNKLQFLGVTFMKIDDGVDTGEILHQFRPELKPKDTVHDVGNKLIIKMTEDLLNKLYFMGLITTRKSLSLCEKLPASVLCRRRFSVVVVRMKFCETMKQAVTYIEHGHLRVGPVVVKNPAFLVTRSMEDHITWVDSSKIKRTVEKYNDRLDDFDLLQA